MKSNKCRITRITRKGLQSRSATYYCSGSEKQTHCWNLWEETETHKSCAERPRVDGFSGKGRAAHIVHH